ncbi:hypothetical protein GAO09_12760 [Rhizobiales bacterium RZME27]|jgi:hypothetical protein|uniref:SMI1/KNR4 family protein n=1 Tax=Endobacterium cereale TaxID=2663029 RepID=A0A6A8ADT3_9HYPH|nr:hypothetical protein [Endobacterium cereale]MEB2844310.1 hypothetical protein [Endobacterium cereale]MQY46901.1 hypothetical protein [Endobacterium cereale]
MGDEARSARIEANRNVLRKRVRQAGYIWARDFANMQPLVSIEEYFAEGVNEEAFETECIPRFGIAAFARLLTEIRERPDVSDVVIEMDDDFETGWPRHDYIFIATSRDAPEVTAWFGEIAPDAIFSVGTTHGFVKARSIRIQDINLAEGYRAWALRWHSDWSRKCEAIWSRLKEAIPRLLVTLERAGMTAVAKRYPATVMDDLIKLSDHASFEAIQWAGYPGGATIPFPADDLVIGDLAEWPRLQLGYRCNAISGAIVPDWPEHLHVIASAGADPFCIDDLTDEIFFARHGMSSWSFEKVADDLAQFIDVIERWVSFYVVDKGENILNEDFEVEASTLAEIRAKVLADLDEGSQAAFIRALGV